MSTPDDPRNLLNELETLQRVLDDAASDQVDHTIPTLEPLEDIPVLDDLFAQSNEPSLQPEPPILSAEPPALRAVPTPAKTATQSPAAQSSATQSSATQSSVTPQSPIPNPAASAAKVTSGNPFLPQAILDRLAHEREAAQYSAEQAQATMAKIMANSPDEPLRFDHEKPATPEPSSAPAALRPAMLKEAMATESVAAEAAANISRIGGQPDSANPDAADQQAMSILDSVLNGDHSDHEVEHSLNSLFGEQPEQAQSSDSNPYLDNPSDSSKTSDNSKNSQAAQAAPSQRLSSFEKARLIDELVEEMLPLMEAKLRAALKDRLG